MATYVVKLTSYLGQHKVALPRALVKSKGWAKVRIIVLEEHSSGHVELRLIHHGDGREIVKRKKNTRKRVIKRERKKA